MDDLNKSLSRLILVLILCFAGVGAALFYETIIKGTQIAKRPYVDRAFIQAMNGLVSQGVIVEKDGKPYFLDEKFSGPEGLRKKVSGYLPYVYVEKGRMRFDENSVAVANERLLSETVMRGRILDRKGVILAESSKDEATGRVKRVYPLGPVAFHPIGYSSPVYGQKFLESALNDILSGSAPRSLLRRLYCLFQSYKVGDDIALTIDSRIQRKAFEALSQKRGAMVVLRIRTGEVLAMASTPSFDPNTPPGKDWALSEHDQDGKPFLNRALSGLYPPGSAFKVVDTSAWLEAQGHGDLKIDCTGYNQKYNIRDNEARAHGKGVTIEKAFVNSCNVFFSDLGVSLGQELRKYAEAFGFNQPIPLIPQDPGRGFTAPSSIAFSWIEYREGSGAGGPMLIKEARLWEEEDFRRNPKLIAQGAIGQNVVMATPLQMAWVAATIANRGVLLRPFIIKAIRMGNPEGKSGWEVRRFKPVEAGRVMEKRTAKKIKDFMVKVMKEGTAKNIKKIYEKDGKYYTVTGAGMEGRPVQVAGKTGTAEIGKGKRPHSWFIGFVPADDPQVAIAVVAENSGYGALVAGPIAVEVMAEALSSLSDAGKNKRDNP